MIVSDLKTWVSTALDDVNNGYFTQPQILVLLNNAQRQVQKYLIQSAQNYYMTCKQTTTVKDSCEYYLPNDFLKCHRVELVLSGTSPNANRIPLTPITRNQEDLYSQTPAVPQAYTLVQNKLKLFPTPDRALTLKLTYSYKVVDMVLDTDTPDVPEQYHEMIALIALRDGYLRDERPAGELDIKIKDYIEMMEQDAADRVQQQGRQIVTTGSYDYPFLY